MNSAHWWASTIYYCLLNRFGSGYTVTVRVDEHPLKIQQLKSFIGRTFGEIQLKEEHRNILHYQFGASNTSLANIFHHLELARDQFHIEDYSVSQTTLDQVESVLASLASVLSPHLAVADWRSLQWKMEQSGR